MASPYCRVKGPGGPISPPLEGEMKGKKKEKKGKEGKRREKKTTRDVDQYDIQHVAYRDGASVHCSKAQTSGYLSTNDVRKAGERWSKEEEALTADR